MDLGHRCHYQQSSMVLEQMDEKKKETKTAIIIKCLFQVLGKDLTGG